MLLKDDSIMILKYMLLLICYFIPWRKAGPYMSPLYYAIYYMCYLKGEDQKFRRAFYQFS